MTVLNNTQTIPDHVCLGGPSNGFCVLMMNLGYRFSQ